MGGEEHGEEAEHAERVGARRWEVHEVTSAP